MEKKYIYTYYATIKSKTLIINTQHTMTQKQKKKDQFP